MLDSNYAYDIKQFFEYIKNEKDGGGCESAPVFIPRSPHCPKRNRGGLAD